MQNDREFREGKDRPTAAYYTELQTQLEQEDLFNADIPARFDEAMVGDPALAHLTEEDRKAIHKCLNTIMVAAESVFYQP